MYFIQSISNNCAYIGVTTSGDYFVTTRRGRLQNKSRNVILFHRNRLRAILSPLSVRNWIIGKDEL